MGWAGLRRGGGLRRGYGAGVTRRTRVGVPGGPAGAFGYRGTPTQVNSRPSRRSPRSAGTWLSSKVIPDALAPGATASQVQATCGQPGGGSRRGTPRRSPAHVGGGDGDEREVGVLGERQGRGRPISARAGRCLPSTRLARPTTAGCARGYRPGGRRASPWGILALRGLTGNRTTWFRDGDGPANEQISYLPLEAMDDEMRAEMERCRREGTPRPESSAVGAHVPACFWAFARSWEAISATGSATAP